MFIDKPQLTDKANTVDEMAKTGYIKLQPQEAGPFQIIEQQSHIVELDERVILNTVTLLRIQAASELRGHCPKTAQTKNSSKN